MKPWLLLALLPALGVSGRAAAQDTEPTAEQTAAARAFFTEGVQLVEEERFDEAGDRFARALDLRWAGPVAYNLALVRAEQGRLVEAVELLRSVTRRAGDNPGVVASAEHYLTRLEPRLARLTIELAAPREGVEVYVDDAEEPLPGAMIGVPIPIDPGAHVLEARRAGTVLGRARADVGEGEAATVTLADLAAPPPPPDAPPPLEDGGEGGGLSTAAWVGIVAAILVVVVAGTAIGVAAPYGGGGGVQGDLPPIEVRP